ncbi:uncharacterized protein LOC124429394 isoform X1 [Vespa crabro]|uniref:uncharacterized protein LOC124429394 isoform X1 n=1 Tax=Vespa crabro TaxID=7445 RepID=UPI001F02CEBA|nr:uncharacterized protein LOC124429394 isoform X1 [Vespa crabro]
MSTISFDKFISLGRKVDQGIRELEELWHLPRVFVGGYADLTEQTEEHIEVLKKSIQCTQVKIIDDINKMIQDNVSNQDAINEMNSFLKEAEDVYNTIKEDIDNLETVFEEYGYHYDKSIVNETIKSKETSTTSDLNDSDDIQEVVFTPDLGWRCKKKSIDKTSSMNGDSYLSEGSAILKKITDIALESKETERTHNTDDLNHTDKDIFTPVSSRRVQKKFDDPLSINRDLYTPRENKILLSAQKSELNSARNKQLLTPLRDRPQYQIYSKHFYSLKKKEANN